MPDDPKKAESSAAGTRIRAGSRTAVIVILGGLLVLAATFVRHLTAPKPTDPGALHQELGWEPVEVPSTPTSAPSRLKLVRDYVRKAPIDGARIRTLRGGVAVGETLSGSNGEYSLPCQEGDFIEGSADGFIAATAPCETDVLSLIPGVQVAGRVMQAGRGIDHAVVRCADQSLNQTVGGNFEVTTDIDGAFELGCPAIALRLTAHPPAGPVVSRRIEAHPPGTIIRGLIIEVPSTRRLSGRITDSNANAGKSIDVIALKDGDEKTPIVARADEEGAFSFHAGFEKYSVTVIATDGRCASSAVPAGSADHVLELVIPEGERLIGRLVGDAVGVTVAARRLPPYSSEPAAVRDRFGRPGTGATYFRKGVVRGDQFAIDGLEPGRYTVSAKSDSAEGTQTATVPQGGELVIQLRATSSLFLAVRNAEQMPVSGGVRIVDGSKRNFNSSIKGGEIEVPGLVPGDCEVSIFPVEGPVPVPTQLNLSPGRNEVTWMLPTESHRIKGIVVDSGGTPIANVQVTPAISFGRTSWASFPFPRSLTDGNGAFEFAVGDPSTLLFFLRAGFESRVLTAADATTVYLVTGTSEQVVRKSTKPPQPQ